MSALFQHISIPEKLSTLLQQYSVRLIPTHFTTRKSVRPITAVYCPPYSNTFQYLKKCPPYSNTFQNLKNCPPYYSSTVSALFQHILLLEKVSALLQHNVHLITRVRCPPYSNIVSALFQHNVRLIPTS